MAQKVADEVYEGELQPLLNPLLSSSE